MVIYMVYVNERFVIDGYIVQLMVGQLLIFLEVDIEIYENLEFGGGCYDLYVDGVGICYLSYYWLLVNMWFKYWIFVFDLFWNFLVDLLILVWFEYKGYDYEVLIDEDVYLEGVVVMVFYVCILNFMYLEYYFECMFDVYEDYIVGGGCFICMGVNSFCCNVVFCEDELWIMECCKIGGYWIVWVVWFGEYYFVMIGQMGGIWIGF